MMPTPDSNSRSRTPRRDAPRPAGTIARHTVNLASSGSTAAPAKGQNVVDAKRVIVGQCFAVEAHPVEGSGAVGTTVVAHRESGIGARELHPESTCRCAGAVECHAHR